MTSDAPELSDAKRAMLEKYLRGELPQTVVREARKAVPSTHTASGAHERVVAIQRGSRSRLPLFFLHGQSNGGGFFCYPLARDLGEDQPLYAVDSYTLHGLTTLPSLETVASAHITSLRAIQPDGPYLLGGYCSGALVALEMARQLSAQGHTVSLLILIDPMAPSDPGLLRSVTNRIGDALRWSRDYIYFGAAATMVLNHLGRMLRLREEVQVQCLLRVLWLQRRLADTYHYLRYPEHRKAMRAGRAGLTRRQARAPSEEALREDYENRFIWLASQYVARGYPGRIAFLWNGDEPINSYRRRAWSEVVNGWDVVEHIVPGTHDSVRAEDLPGLAKRLRLCLDEAQTMER